MHDATAKPIAATGTTVMKKAASQALTVLSGLTWFGTLEPNSVGRAWSKTSPRPTACPVRHGGQQLVTAVNAASANRDILDRSATY